MKEEIIVIEKQLKKILSYNQLNKIVTDFRKLVSNNRSDLELTKTTRKLIVVAQKFDDKTFRRS